MTSTKVGDIVWFNHGVHETVMTSDQPLLAFVCYVHEARKHPENHYPPKVNLAVFGKNGDQFQKHGVMLWDGEGDAPDLSHAFAYPVGGDPSPKAPEPVVAPVDEPDAVVAKPPTYSVTPVAPSDEWNGDAPTGFEAGSTGLPLPASSPANPNRPLD
jgi:hypothetical protein